MIAHRFLDRLSDLADLTPAERSAIAAACAPPVTIERGESIVHMGEEPDFSVALLSGFACRVNDLSGGRRQILSFQVPGEGVDLYGYALKRLDHTVVALTRCEISRIPHVELDRLIEQFPTLSLVFWRETMLGASVMREHLLRVGQRQALERTANLYCELAYRFDGAGVGDGVTYPFPINQATIAAALGLSVVHVNRVMKSLKDEGVMTQSRTRLVIRDRGKLLKIGDFDPAYLERVKALPARPAQTSVDGSIPGEA